MARRLAREGYIACVTRRSADKLQPLVDQIRADGGQAHGIASNARKVDDRVALVQQIKRDIAPVEVTVFNIGTNVRFGITETTARVYFKVWAMACFGGFLMGRECTRVMLPRGRGTNVFTGVTASLQSGSRLVLVATMFLGRVGAVTLVAALAGTTNKATNEYPEERIMLG